MAFLAVLVLGLISIWIFARGPRFAGDPNDAPAYALMGALMFAPLVGFPIGIVVALLRSRYEEKQHLA